jgi:hypothetical protein
MMIIIVGIMMTSTVRQKGSPYHSLVRSFF